MIRMLSAFLGLAALLAAGCATQQTVAVPDKLKPGAGESLAMIVPAKGVQIYECRAGKDGGYEWAFVAPEADLFDTRGNRIGRHYAGPHWEAADGSKILGELEGTRRRAAGRRDSLAPAQREVGGTGGLLQQGHQHPARKHRGRGRTEDGLQQGRGRVLRRGSTTRRTTTSSRRSRR